MPTDDDLWALLARDISTNPSAGDSAPVSANDGGSLPLPLPLTLLATNETRLVVMGAPRSGKSSLLARFLDRTSTRATHVTRTNDSAGVADSETFVESSTPGLEFTYARRTRSAASAHKDVCAIWELVVVRSNNSKQNNNNNNAGTTTTTTTTTTTRSSSISSSGNYNNGHTGSSVHRIREQPLARLLDIAMPNNLAIQSTGVVVVVDISQPRRLVEDIEAAISMMARRVATLLDDLERRGSRRPAAIRAHAAKRWLAAASGSGHPAAIDAAAATTSLLVPVSWALVGTKYDLFKQLARDKRVQVSAVMRYYAHVYGGCLCFTSERDEVAWAKFKPLITSLAFRVPGAKANALDDASDKPLLVAQPGSDSLEAIFAAAQCEPSLDALKAALARACSGDSERREPAAVSERKKGEPEAQDAAAAVTTVESLMTDPKYADAVVDRALMTRAPAVI